MLSYHPLTAESFILAQASAELPQELGVVVQGLESVQALVVVRRRPLSAEPTRVQWRLRLKSWL